MANLNLNVEENIIPKINKTADILKSLGVILGTCLAIVGVGWTLVAPAVKDFVVRSIPTNMYATASETTELHRNIDALLLSHRQLAEAVEELGDDNKSIRDALAKQEANIRILIFITQGSEKALRDSNINP